MSQAAPAALPTAPPLARPRLGFLGVGWIGRHRLEAVALSGLGEIVAVADPAPALVEQACAHVPGAARLRTLEDLLRLDLDGVVIATPSALHAEQSQAALERGLAVFCQKPLGRSAAETRAVVEAARRAGCLLGVDLSYRFVNGVAAMRDLIQSGRLGRVYAANLVFHNAYGPDKPWFYDPALSGGGCVIDLGIHLVDLALWLLDFPQVQAVSSQLFAHGVPLAAAGAQVENYAAAQLRLAGPAAVQLACSWKLPAGQDCVIEASFYGTAGGVRLRNCDGSFYDFRVEHLEGTRRHTLAAPPDAWGGRAAVDWLRRLAAGAGYDPASEHLVTVAEALDGIYGR